MNSWARGRCLVLPVNINSSSERHWMNWSDNNLSTAVLHLRLIKLSGADNGLWTVEFTVGRAN